MSVGQYVYNVAFAFDRFANAALGGDPDWTLSQRMGQAVANGRCVGCYWLCRLLSLVDRRHCRTSWQPEKPADERLWTVYTAWVVGWSGVVALAGWALW